MLIFSTIFLIISILPFVDENGDFNRTCLKHKQVANNEIISDLFVIFVAPDENNLAPSIP